MTDRTPTTAACDFVPANEPWSCRVHPGGIRTSLDETRCRRPGTGRHKHTLECEECFALAQTVARLNGEAEAEGLRVALERAIEAMDLVRDGLAVRSTDAIVIGEESILRHAAREARAALEEPTP